MYGTGCLSLGARLGGGHRLDTRLSKPTFQNKQKHEASHFVCSRCDFSCCCTRWYVTSSHLFSLDNKVLFQTLSKQILQVPEPWLTIVGGYKGASPPAAVTITIPIKRLITSTIFSTYTIAKTTSVTNFVTVTSTQVQTVQAFSTAISTSVIPSTSTRTVAALSTSVSVVQVTVANLQTQTFTSTLTATTTQIVQQTAKAKTTVTVAGVSVVTSINTKYVPSFIISTQTTTITQVSPTTLRVTAETYPGKSQYYASQPTSSKVTPTSTTSESSSNVIPTLTTSYSSVSSPTGSVSPGDSGDEQENQAITARRPRMW